MIDTTTATPTASATAAVCESMALYGASPERGELDSRVVWDKDDAIDALNEAIRVIVDGITVDGTQMADEREAPDVGLRQLPAFTGHPPRPRRRPHRARDEGPREGPGRIGGEGVGAADHDRPRPEPRRSPRTPSSSSATSPPTHTASRPATPGARGTARTHRRPASSPPPPSTHATSAALARTARPARTCPRARSSQSPAARPSTMPTPGVWSTLDMARAKYGDMVLLHGGGLGVEKIAASWAECQRRQPGHLPPRTGPRTARPRPSGRNDDLLNLLPKGRLRVPRQRDHRQPRRQSSAARHSCHEGSARPHDDRATCPLRADRCLCGDRLPPFSPCPPRPSRRRASRDRRSRSNRQPSQTRPRHRGRHGAAHRRRTLASWQRDGPR